MPKDSAPVVRDKTIALAEPAKKKLDQVEIPNYDREVSSEEFV